MINSFLDKLEENNNVYYFSIVEQICFRVNKADSKFFESNFNEADFQYFLDLINYEIEIEDVEDNVDFVNDWLDGFHVENWYIISDAYNYTYDDTLEEQTTKNVLEVLYDFL